MSRNPKPDNIVDAFLYIAKRCLTPGEQNDLSEKLRDPRIQQQQQPQHQGYHGGAPRDTYYDANANVAPRPYVRAEQSVPAPASAGRFNNNTNNNYDGYNRGYNRGGNQGRNRDEAAGQGYQQQAGGVNRGRGRGQQQQAAPLAPLAVSAGGEAPAEKRKRNNRRPQRDDEAGAADRNQAPLPQRRERGRGRGAQQQ